MTTTSRAPGSTGGAAGSGATAGGTPPRQATKGMSIAELKALKAAEAPASSSTPPGRASPGPPAASVKAPSASGWGGSARAAGAPGGGAGLPATVRGHMAMSGASGGPGGPGQGLSEKQAKDFEDMLAAMNLPPAGKAQMMLLPAGQKLELLESHKSKLKNLQVGDRGGKVKNSPQFFINALATPTALELQTLRVCAVSEPILWLETFHSLGGIALVVKIVSDLQKKKELSAEDEAVVLEACRCVVSMCKADGLRMVTEVPNVVTIFALCLDTRNPMIKMEVYDFLSLLCNLMGPSYAMVLDAMEAFKFQKREPIKYQHLVQTLQHEEIPTVQARALQLINSIISAPSDLDQRVNQRNAFLRLGLRDILNRVKKSIPHNADFAAQFDTFVLDEKEDQDALKAVVPGYEASADVSDDRGMFEAIKRKVDPSPVLSSQFLSSLGSLLRLPTSDTEGVKVWNLVSTLLQQISLGKGYLAVDGEYVLDVSELLNSNALRAELEMTREDHRNLQQSSAETTKKLREEIRAARDELAALKAAPPSAPAVDVEAATKLQTEVAELKEQLEEAVYNSEKAGSRVADLAAVIERLEASRELDRLAAAKELEQANDARETELWNERMVEVARKEEEIAALKRVQLDSDSRIDSLTRSLRDMESKVKAGAAAGGGGGGAPTGGSSMEQDALLKWALSQEELNRALSELNDLKKDFLEVNADRAKVVTKAAEAKQKVEEQLLDAKQALEIARRGREAAEMKSKELEAEVERAKAAVAAAAAAAAAAPAGGGGGGEGGSAAAVPEPPSEAFAGPPPPPPPPDFGGPPPPPPPPGGDGGFAPPPPPPPPGGDGSGPPPPPPPPGGGPPGPPPPPGGGPPGPPPPGGFGGAAKAKWRPNLPKPSIKTKQLNWEKIPVNVAEKSVFNSLKDNLEALPIDWQSVEKLFAAPVAHAKAVAEGRGAGGPGGAPAEVSLLDPKRAHAIGIYLRRLNFNVSVENVVECIGLFDRSTIDLEFIERLIFNAPQPDEIALLKQYVADGGVVDVLAKPERFFYELSKVPQLVARLTSFRTVLTFKKRADATKAQISGLRDAFEQLINSDRLKELLKIVLALGNFLNGRSARGDACAFKLKSLTSLTDTKTADNKSTLLHFLVSHLTTHSPGALSVTAELAGVQAASGTKWDELQNDIATLKKDQSALAVASVQVQIMEGFDFRDAWPKTVTDELVKEYEADVVAMERGIAGAETEWKTLAAMYGENPEQVRPESLLADIGLFVSALNGVRKELTMTITTAPAVNMPVKRMEEKGTVDAVVADGGAQDVDNLKSAIQSGQAFEQRREQRRVARGQTIRGNKF